MILDIYSYHLKKPKIDLNKIRYQFLSQYNTKIYFKHCLDLALKYFLHLFLQCLPTFLVLLKKYHQIINLFHLSKNRLHKIKIKN